VTLGRAETSTVYRRVQWYGSACERFSCRGTLLARDFSEEAACCTRSRSFCSSPGCSVSWALTRSANSFTFCWLSHSSCSWRVSCPGAEQWYEAQSERSRRELSRSSSSARSVDLEPSASGEHSRCRGYRTGSAESANVCRPFQRCSHSRDGKRSLCSRPSGLVHGMAGDQHRPSF